jgi:hypothetical protein
MNLSINSATVHKLLLVCASIIVAIPVAVRGEAEETPQTEVIVLSTLHQLHGEIEGYSFQDLLNLIEQLNPDVLAVELTTEDLESRRDHSTKQEYQESVFPLLEKYNYIVVPLEPSQPLFDEIVGLVRTAQSNLSARKPVLAEAFGIYAESLYEMLRETWTSPEAVNSRDTDLLFESKHRYQNAIFGPMEAEGWERWNQHFLDQILDASKNNPGKRIVVLVGAEHSYWLRAHLKTLDVLLLDTKKLISCSQISD